MTTHELQISGTATASWKRYKELRSRVIVFLKTSEEEFSGLIGLLDAYWKLAEEMQATTRESSEDEPGHPSKIRRSLVDGHEVFEDFLAVMMSTCGQLRKANLQIKQLGMASRRLDRLLALLKYIAFYFRLEGALLPTEDQVFVAKMYEQMLSVTTSIERAAQAQQDTLDTALKILTTASTSIEHSSSSYADQSEKAREHVQVDLEALTTLPADMLAARTHAVDVAAAVSQVFAQFKVLQSHDAMRQRVEHILGALDQVQQGERDDPGSILLVQHHQAVDVIALIEQTGAQIQRDLEAVMHSADGIACEATESSEDGDHAFAKTIERLTRVGTELASLLAGEVEVGALIEGQTAPVRDLLCARSNELEALAQTTKILALNVQVGSAGIVGARCIDVLGSATSRGAQEVMELATELAGLFAELIAPLSEKLDLVSERVHAVSSAHAQLLANGSGKQILEGRGLRRQELRRQRQQTAELTRDTEQRLSTMRFVDEGAGLLRELDDLLGELIEAYPKSDVRLDINDLAGSYTMRQERSVLASLTGAETSGELRQLEPAAQQGEDIFGDNVELF